VRRLEIDLALRAPEAQRKPFLLLAAVAALQGEADEVRRQVIGQPFGMLAQHFCIARADFLFELAQGGGARVFAGIDAALRHLPGLDALVDPLADEDAAFAVEQHHADAGTIGQLGSHGGNMPAIAGREEAR
jgi:hypothetical protein